MKTTKQNPAKSRRAPRILFAAAALALAACQPTLTEWTESESPKAIDVQRLSGSLNLAVTGADLSADQAARIDDFLSRQGNLFNLRVTVAGHAGDSLASVEQFLIARGVRPSHISRGKGASLTSGNVEIVAERYVAAPPSCPDWSHANIMDTTNSNSSNFGCADASNLARMVADPRDLLVGRSLAPASGTAAAAAAGRYNTGQVKELPVFRYSATTE